MKKKVFILIIWHGSFLVQIHIHTHIHTRTHIHTPHNKGKQKGMTSSFTRHINMLSGKIKPFSSRTVKKHTLVNVPEGP